MTKDMSQHQKEFYEEYWKQRENENYIHTKNNMWIPPRIRIAVNMILRDYNINGNKSIRVLDVGCGEGAFGRLLTERLKDQVDIVGCDISNTALTRASSHYSCVFQADIEKNELVEKLYSQRFDYIILLEVLEHLFRPGKVLSQCYEILKDDGVLLASFPNIAWYKYRIDMLMGNFPKNYLLYPGEHIQNFTLDSFYNLKNIFPNLNITTVDIDKSGLQLARNQRLNVLQASALELPIRDNQVDVVLCLGIIEHVKEDSRLIKEISRVLKKGGKVILSTPMQNGISFPLISKEKSKIINQNWGHVRMGYDLKELEILFKNDDLAIEKTSKYFNLFTKLAYLFLLSSYPILNRVGRLLYGLTIKLEPYIRYKAEGHIIIGKK